MHRQTKTNLKSKEQQTDCLFLHSPMIEKKIGIVFLASLFFLSNLCFGQITYGVRFQAFNGGIKGSAIADSILLVTDTRPTSILLYVPQNIGLFLEYRLGKIPFMLRTEINYRPHPVGLDANIFNGKSFGGKPDGVYTYKTLNFGFDIPITLNYNLIQKENFAFLKLKRLEMGVFAGVTIQLQARGERETYAIGQNFNSPGISEVNFAVYNTIRTTNYFYNYGIRVRLGHLITTYRLDFLLTPSGTNDLKVWGNTYSYKTTHQYQSVSLAYTFSFKKKSRKD